MYRKRDHEIDMVGGRVLSTWMGPQREQRRPVKEPKLGPPKYTNGPTLTSIKKMLVLHLLILNQIS